MAIANDTFVEGIDTALELHTPTGPNAGSGWTIVAATVITVIAAVDKARGVAPPNSGNRYQMDDDLGFDEMDVSLDQEFGATTVPGDLIFGGPTGRAPAVPAVAAYTYVYEWSLGITFGSYSLSDSGGADSFEEDWGAPTTPKRLLLQVRNSDHRGFADGVEKVVLITNLGVGDTRAGMGQANFEGGAPPFPQADNYQSEGIAPPPPPPVDNPFPEYGQGRAVIGDPVVYGATIVRS